MCISTRIKNRRIELDMTVEELAAKINKNKATIYRYENGDIGKMPYDVLEPLSKALNVSVGYLLGSTDIKPLSKNEEKLLNNYNRLNNLGQKEAIKRVSELTEIDKYTTTYITMAAHNDDASEEQIELMKKDFEEMDKW
nr:helix-turn-helix transcriptional regulator [Peptostreptococcus canis]